MGRMRLILDTDLAMGAPGSDVDDGFALAMAVADPGVDLDLVTTVSGNTDVENATSLTRAVLHRLDRPEIRVVEGADRSLAEGAESNAGVDAMIGPVLARPGEITLVAIGPLTNVALAIRAEPRFLRSLASLVIMGGVFSSRPSRPGLPGEFNVWSDPEAAQLVLDADVPARWVGLDVTRQVRLTRSEAAEMAASSGEFESFAGQYCLGWIDHLAEQGDDTGSCALHDPLAVAVVTRSDLVAFEPVRLTVGRGEAERGAMTVDRSSGSANAQIGVEVDAAGFRAHFRALLRKLDQTG